MTKAADSNTLIFTDLDGTLLDHYSYSFAPAKTSLDKLAELAIPVIINSSKTFAEIQEYREVVGHHQPFIVENGAAVYLPVGSFTQQPNGTKEINGYWVKSFSHIREYWLSLSNNQFAEFVTEYTSFEQMSVPQLSALTGLSQRQAELAKQREFCEPIHWHGSAERKAQFIHRLLSLGVGVQQGGRFLHLCDHCDKGQAQLWLCEQYRQQNAGSELVSISLGDGANDVPMLEVANIAVQIRSPVHDFLKVKARQQLIKTQAYGPSGWAEAINHLIFSTHTS